jgi:hypothetical protein
MESRFIVDHQDYPSQKTDWYTMISQKIKKMLRNLDFAAQNMINFMFI